METTKRHGYVAKGTQGPDNVLRFPESVQHRVDRAALQAVRVLAQADLISEQEAVASLHSLGAGTEECDLYRTLYAVRRGRL